MRRRTVLGAVTAFYAALTVLTSSAETFIYAKPVTGGDVSYLDWTSWKPSPGFFSDGFSLSQPQNVLNASILGRNVQEPLLASWLSGWMLTNWSTMGSRYATLAGDSALIHPGFFFELPQWVQVNSFVPDQVAAITQLNGELGPNSVFHIETFQSSTEWSDQTALEAAGFLTIVLLLIQLLRIRMDRLSQPHETVQQRQISARALLNACRKGA